jgi:DNA-binding CsgD family transcriptional regulator
LIATESPDPDAVVNHLRRAGDGRLVEWLITAAERARRAFAMASTVALYEEALSLLPASAPTHERFGVLLQLANFLRLQPDGVAYAEDALHTARQLGDPLLEGVALTRLGTNRTYVESIAEGLVEQERAVTILSKLPENETHWLTAYSTRIGAVAVSVPGRITVARDFLAMTYAIVGRFADLDLEADPGGNHNGWYGLAIRDAALGHPQAARAHLQQVVARVRANGDYANLGGALELDLVYVMIPYYADNAAEMRRLADAAVSARAELGEEMLGRPVRSMGMAALYLHGDWEEVWSLFVGMRRFPRAVFSDFREAPVALIPARGETDLAWTLVQEMFPAGTATGPGTVPYRRSLALQETAAAMLMDAGDLPGARAWLEMHDRWLAWSGAVLGQSEGEALWAQHERQAGDATQALAHAERALALATDPRQPLALLAAHRLLGELATEAGAFDAATQHLGASLALADACAAPYERALTLLAQAQMRATTGDIDMARQCVDEVRTICVPLGAKPALARADALAARLDAAQSTAPSYPAGLSAREVEVLRLVAEGLSSPQIGERLFLSPRTVEQHLRSIFNKTGVPSRAAAARWAAEQGLV